MNQNRFIRGCCHSFGIDLFLVVGIATLLLSHTIWFLNGTDAAKFCAVILFFNVQKAKY